MSANRVHVELGEYPHSCRRFNLGDALLLIAALGSILAFNRALPANLSNELPRFRDEFGYLFLNGWSKPRFAAGWTSGQIFKHLLANTWLLSDRLLHSVVISLTPAIFLMRLREPRPRLLKVFQQAGALASLGAIVAFCLSWTARFYLAYVPPTVLLIGGTVAAFWLFLTVSGCRMREPGWIDTVGRLVGFGWIYLASAYAIQLFTLY